MDVVQFVTFEIDVHHLFQLHILSCTCIPLSLYVWTGHPCLFLSDCILNLREKIAHYKMHSEVQSIKIFLFLSYKVSLKSTLQK